MPKPDVRIRVGLDVVGVERVARLVAAHADRLDAVFTSGELEYCAGKRRSAEHLAVRFAAKEAVLKALGTGLRRRMNWTDVEVVHGSGGRPEVRLHGEVAIEARRRQIASVEISLSHAAGLAAAHAVTVAGA